MKRRAVGLAAFFSYQLENGTDNQMNPHYNRGGGDSF